MLYVKMCVYVKALVFRLCSQGLDFTSGKCKHSGMRIPVKHWD